MSLLIWTTPNSFQWFSNLNITSQLEKTRTVPYTIYWTNHWALSSRDLTSNGPFYRVPGQFDNHAGYVSQRDTVSEFTVLNVVVGVNSRLGTIFHDWDRNVLVFIGSGVSLGVSLALLSTTQTRIFSEKSKHFWNWSDVMWREVK